MASPGVYKIGGQSIMFPCKPYPSQFSMIDKILKGLDRRQNCLLESPTGSGKSLALLCSAIAWQASQYDKENASDSADCCQGSKDMADCTCHCEHVNMKSNQDDMVKKVKNLIDNSAEKTIDLTDDDDDFQQPNQSFRTNKDKGKVARKHQTISYDDETSKSSNSSKACPECCTCQQNNSRDNENTRRVKIPKIYFGTRTHKQITQIIRELNKTAYKDVRMAILASRDHMCINQGVLRSKNINEGCRDLLKDGPGCRFFDRAKRKLLTQGQLNDAGLHTAWDIEDFVKTCKTAQACPYFVTKNILAEADIIFCPYNYLIDPIIRKSMEINIKSNIFILDEAHNIEDSARDAAGATIMQDQLQISSKELSELFHHNIKPVEHITLMHVASKLDNFIDETSHQLEQRDFEQSSKVFSGMDIVANLNQLDMGPQHLSELKEAFNTACEEQKDEKVARNAMGREIKMSGTTRQTFEVILKVLDYIYRDDMKFLDDYRVAILKTISYSAPKQTNGQWLHSRGRRGFNPTTVHSINFWCMNPGVAFSDFGISRSVILTSGTLSPMTSFQSELGVPFPIQLEANHVIKDKQVWVGAIGEGPRGSALQAVYRNMETLNFQDEIGELILKVCLTVPYGVLCFFPSYSSLDKFSKRWQTTGLWSKMAKRKVLVTEPRKADKVDFEEVMKFFYRVIAGDDCGDDDDNVRSEEVDGALFFAVCRGKVSEGLDFADNNARAVITIGIPYPNFKDAQVEMKRKYNDTHSRSRGLLSGSEWYEIQAFRALNQALGRCIRHRNDWGALILVDERFTKHNNKYCKGLSKWVRNKVMPFDKFDIGIDSLKCFTESREKDSDCTSFSQPNSQTSCLETPAKTTVLPVDLDLSSNQTVIGTTLDAASFSTTQPDVTSVSEGNRRNFLHETPSKAFMDNLCSTPVHLNRNELKDCKQTEPAAVGNKEVERFSRFFNMNSNNHIIKSKTAASSTEVKDICSGDLRTEKSFQQNENSVRPKKMLMSLGGVSFVNKKSIEEQAIVKMEEDRIETTNNCFIDSETKPETIENSSDEKKEHIKSQIMTALNHRKESTDTKDEEEFETLVTKRGRKRKSRNSDRSKGKKRKGVDFLDSMNSSNENKIDLSVGVYCKQCQCFLAIAKDYEQQKHVPSFMNASGTLTNKAKVLFFPKLDVQETLQPVKSQLDSGLNLNCQYDTDTGCGVQYLTCAKCLTTENCSRSAGITGAQIIWAPSTDTEYKANQIWLFTSAVKLQNGENT